MAPRHWFFLKFPNEPNVQPNMGTTGLIVKAHFLSRLYHQQQDNFEQSHLLSIPQFSNLQNGHKHGTYLQVL